MIKFRNITQQEFEKYREYSIKDYAEDLIRSKIETEENAMKSALSEFNTILPRGLNTPDNHIYVIENEAAESIGLIWYGRDFNEEAAAYIFDFLILEKFRKKGYGTASLLEIEKDVKAHGYTKISLNVFNFNEGAHSLYELNGYKPSNIFEGHMIMEKDINR